MSPRVGAWGTGSVGIGWLAFERQAQGGVAYYVEELSSPGGAVPQGQQGLSAETSKFRKEKDMVNTQFQSGRGGVYTLTRFSGCCEDTGP